MKAILKNTLLTLLLFGSLCATAQQWKNYTSTQNPTCLAEHNDTLWMGTRGGVVKLLKNGTRLATYTHADGLAANFVIKVAVDPQGNKWFLTTIPQGYGDYGGGLSKFDGTNWTICDTNNTGLPTLGIYSMLADAQNNFWFATTMGLTKFDGVTWTNYNNANSPLPGTWASNLMLDKAGNVWCASGGYFVKISGGNWSLIPIPSNITLGSIALDNQGNLWTTWVPSSPWAQQIGVAKYDGTNWSIISTTTGGYSIAIDAQNNKWFTLKNNSLLKFDDVNWTTYTSPNSNISPEYFLLTDSSHTMWFSTEGNYPSQGNGLGSFDGTNWNLYNPSNTGLTGNSISAFAADRHGNNWAASFGAGGYTLLKFNETKWDTILTQGVYLGFMYTDVKDRVWFGQSYFDGTNWNVVTAPPDNDATIYMGIDEQCNTWFRAYTPELYRYDGANWITYNTTNSGINYSIVRSLNTDLQEHVWFGTEEGVLEFNGTNWVKYDSLNSGLVANFIISTEIDLQGNKWFGTEHGVSKFDGTNWTTYTAQNSGLPANRVHEITTDKEGALWFATSNPTTYMHNGVAKFHNNNWITYNSFNSGLCANRVYSIVADHDNNKWFTTEQGLALLTSGNNQFTARVRYTGSICSTGTLTLNPVLHNGTPPYTYNWQSTSNTLSCSTCQNPTLPVLQNDVLMLSVTDANNNTATDTLYLYYCGYTNLQSAVEDLKELNVFPNPGQNQFYITLNDNNVGSTYTLYDLYGRPLISGNLNSSNTKVDVREIPTGMYVLKADNYKPKLLQVVGN